MDRLDFPIFDYEWTATQEIALLAGISQSGIDNWQKISERLGLKTPNDCEAHFYSFYYKSQDYPIPSIEDVGAIRRAATTHEPVLKDSILKAGRTRTEKYLEEKKKTEKHDGKPREGRAKPNKDDDNGSSEHSKNKGKYRVLVFSCVLRILFFIAHLNFRKPNQ